MVAPWAKRQPETPPHYNFVQGRNSDNRRDDFPPIQPPSYLFPRESVEPPIERNSFQSSRYPSPPWESPRPIPVSPIETPDTPRITTTTSSLTDDYFGRISNMVSRIENNIIQPHSFRHSPRANIVRPLRSSSQTSRRFPLIRNYETDDNIGDNNSIIETSDDEL